MTKYNVYAVSMKTHKPVDIFIRNASEVNADAVINMAIMRQGLRSKFFPMVEVDSPKDLEYRAHLKLD